MNRASRIAGGICLFLGGALIILFGVFKFVRPVEAYVKRARITSAVVKGYDCKSGDYAKSPLFVEYQPEGSSEPLTFNLDVRAKVFVPRCGQTIRIYYDPDDPYDARDSYPPTLYFSALVLMLFAAPFFLFGLLLFILAILNRESLFDLSQGAGEGGIAFTVGMRMAKVNTLVFIFLLLLKLIADIPRQIYPAPWIIFSFILVFVITISVFVILAALNRGK